MSYLKVVYDRKREPRTTYPSALIGYLIKRFGLKKGDALLELGMGNGDFLEEFHKRGISCTGVDREISPEVKHGIKVKKINLSRQKLPFANNSFDVVYHKSVLEHFYRNETDFIMSETCRVLKKGGKLIILVPEWPSQIQTFFEDYSHVHPYDACGLGDLLKIYGFKNVSSEKFYQLPEIWKFPQLKHLSRLLSIFMTTSFAREMTEQTGIKFFRWSKELMVLGYGEK
jgi:ubiquinone/menaquinone biosynthesis C-methylase UbiE